MSACLPEVVRLVQLFACLFIAVFLQLLILAVIHMALPRHPIIVYPFRCKSLIANFSFPSWYWYRFCVQLQFYSIMSIFCELPLVAMNEWKARQLGGIICSSEDKSGIQLWKSICKTFINDQKRCLNIDWSRPLFYCRFYYCCFWISVPSAVE